MARSATSARSTFRPIGAIAIMCARRSRRFSARAPLRAKLRRIFLAALDLYLSGEDGPRGCFTVLTASSEAIADPEIRDIVAEAIDTIDRAFARLFAEAREAGELPADTDTRRSPAWRRATIHTLSVRARARYPRAELVPIVDDAVATICGPEASRADRRIGKPRNGS